MLADLTPIAPTHYVVVTLLLINAATVVLLHRDHRAGSLAGGAGAPLGPRRRQAACPHRRPVLADRRGAGDPGRHRRQRHARPRPRPAVLDPHPRGDREFADRGAGLSQRPRPDRALRHHGHGLRTVALEDRCSMPSPTSSSSSSPCRPPCAVSARSSCSIRTSTSSRAPTCRPTRPSRCRRARRCRPSATRSRKSCCCRTPIMSRPSSSCRISTTAISTSRVCSIRASCRNCARRRRASSEYTAIEARRVGVQVAFALMYTVIALIVLLSAVWIGFNFANRLVAPIRRLIGAANVVSTGNLYVHVPVRQAGGRSRPARRDLQPHDPGIAHAARRSSCARATSSTAAAGSPRRCWPAPAPASSASTATAIQHSQPLGGKADRPQRRRGARPAADGSLARADADHARRQDRRAARRIR